MPYTSGENYAKLQVNKLPVEVRSLLYVNEFYAGSRYILQTELWTFRSSASTYSTSATHLHFTSLITWTICAVACSLNLTCLIDPSCENGPIDGICFLGRRLQTLAIIPSLALTRPRSFLFSSKQSSYRNLIIHGLIRHVGDNPCFFEMDEHIK